MDGDVQAARELAGSALKIAEKTNDLTVAWRACSVSATASEAIGDAGAAAEARRRGLVIVRSIASSLGDEELRDSFLARPEIATLHQAMDP